MGTLGEVEQLLTSIRDRRRGDILPGEAVRLADAETRILSLKAKLERDRELLEDKIVKEHPFWRKIRTKMLEALRPHPEAARAVAEALAELGA